MVSQGKGCAKCLHFDNFIISTHKIILYLDSCGMASPVWHCLYAYKWYPFIKALCVYAGTAHCLRLVCMGVQLNCTGRKFPARRVTTRKNITRDFFPRFSNKSSHKWTDLPNFLVLSSVVLGLSFSQALSVIINVHLHSGGAEPAQLIQLYIWAAEGLSTSRRGRGDEEPPFIFIVLVLNDRLLVLSADLLL